MWGLRVKGRGELGGAGEGVASSQTLSKSHQPLAAPHLHRCPQPTWYAVLQETAAAAPPEPAPAPSPTAAPTLGGMPADALWKTPWVRADAHPHPRFEHGACVLGNCMYVLGGNCGAPRRRRLRLQPAPVSRAW